MRWLYCAMHSYLLFGCIICYAQKMQDSLVFSKSDSIRFWVDNMENVYVLKYPRTILKYDNNLKLIRQYHNTRNGNIYDMDISNPMNVLLYSRDFNNVVFLDFQLNILEKYKLQTWYNGQIELICRANDNFFWIYDIAELKLKKISEQGKVVVESIELTNFNVESPTRLFFKNEKIYLYDTNRGLLVFDNFGTYIKTLPLPNVAIQQVQDNGDIVFLEKGKMELFDSETLRSVNVLKTKQCKQWRTTAKKQYYLQNNNVLYIEVNEY